MGDLDEALRLALLRDLRGLRGAAPDDFGDDIVAALQLADHVYPQRQAAGGGHLAGVMSRSRDAYQDWVAMHRRREERDAAHAEDRARGREAFEAARRRLAGEAPERQWSPMVAACVFGEQPDEFGIW